jgi:hypothetical protein
MKWTKDDPSRKGSRAAWRLFLPVASGLIVVAFAASLAAGDGRHDGGRDDDEQEGYAIGLWGDLPYSDVQALTGVPNLIADMNLQNLKFTVHDGDLKGGNATAGSKTPTTCSDALYEQALGFFNSLRAPAIFTPGDNDWTDCDRPKNGSFNSLERLDHERELFFSDAWSLGRRRIHMYVQTEPLCLGFGGGKVPCVENRRWHVGGVTYVTLNIQGSCNNLCDTAPDPVEYAARNAANIAWLQESFLVAARRHSVAIMIISQANPGWYLNEDDASPRDPQTLVQKDPRPDRDKDGFREFLLALRAEVIAFRKPVVYVHGDSHTFRIDKPLFDGNEPNVRLENFTRLETFGDNVKGKNDNRDNNDVNWVKVLVDARSREVFSFQPQIVPANRVAHPTP